MQEDRGPARLAGQAGDTLGAWEGVAAAATLQSFPCGLRMGFPLTWTVFREITSPRKNP